MKTNERKIRGEVWGTRRSLDSRPNPSPFFPLAVHRVYPVFRAAAEPTERLEQACSCFVAFPFLYLQFLYSGFHFPLSCSQLLMFEFARSGNGTAVQEILAKSRQIGVELEEFLNTLLGK